MSLIFDQEKHEKIITTPWDKNRVQEVIKDIFDRTTSSLTDQLWPPHPNEDSEASVNKSFYLGAAGTLWGLLYLSKKNGFILPFSSQELIQKIQKLYLLEPDTGSACPSYFLGEVGISLLDYKITPRKETADKLYDLIKSNIQNPCVDSLWGCPGTMLPALFLFEWTNDDRWKDLYLENAGHLFETWKFNEQSGAWYWEYKQDDRVIPFIGSGHGYFGNIFPLLKGLEFLSFEKREIVLTRTIEMTKKFSKVENDKANWPATFFNEKGTSHFVVQWCHGAPGMIQSLEPIVKDQDNELEKLFVNAGELIWNAGPLKKGIGICHGTDGNGMSLLKLYQRTGNPKWLDRAQKFAMHSIEKRNGRFTLWTGEIGLACFLQACLDEEGFFPGLDFF